MDAHLYLLRHAQAADPTAGADDVLRALSPEGRESARAIARVLSHLRPSDAPIWTSPALRCRGTAHVVAAAAGADAPVVHPALKDGAEASELELLAREAPAGALLVGHQPSLATLAGRLVGSAAAFPFAQPGWLVVLRRAPDSASWTTWLSAHPEALESLG